MVQDSELDLVYQYFIPFYN